MISDNSVPEIPESREISSEAAEALAVFRAISAAREMYGFSAIGLFIISMTQGADDVLTALALTGIANPGSEGPSKLDVAPLLETVDDLEAVFYACYGRLIVGNV